MGEIKKAIRTLNNGKAAGPDGFPAEAMKAAQEISMEVFHPLFEKIWEEGYIVKLPKAGDLSQCKNYRGKMSGGQVVAKTTALQTTALNIGLKINVKKTKVMMINISRTGQIRLGDNETEDVTSFTFLGSIVDKTGGTDQDIKIRI